MILVCPDGFESLDGMNCVKLIDTAASKADALTQCHSVNPRATLVTPKTDLQQRNLVQFLKDHNVNEDVHLGLSKKDDGFWYWDDGEPLFVQRRI